MHSIGASDTNSMRKFLFKCKFEQHDRRLNRILYAQRIYLNKRIRTRASRTKVLVGILKYWKHKHYSRWFSRSRLTLSPCWLLSTLFPSSLSSSHTHPSPIVWRCVWSTEAPALWTQRTDNGDSQLHSADYFLKNVSFQISRWTSASNAPPTTLRGSVIRSSVVPPERLPCGIHYHII